MNNYMLDFLTMTGTAGHRVSCRLIENKDILSKYSEKKWIRSLLIDENEKSRIESIISLPYYYTSNFTIQDIFIELGIEEWLI